MITLLARSRKPVRPYVPLHLLRHPYSSLSLNEPRKKVDHQVHKQQIIERKKEHVNTFIQQGIVRKAADLLKNVQKETNAKYISEPDDPYYNVPKSSAQDDEERVYIPIEEGKRRKKKKTEPGEQEEEVDGMKQRKDTTTTKNMEFVKSYPDWCAYYKPIFEQSPYSIGHQQPDEHGAYTWSHALDTANKMVFGNEGFKHLQLETLNASLRGEDVFLSLPTGGGKSLCFWLRALLSPGAVVVISPLIALIHDQIQKLSSRGIPVLKLDSTSKAVAIKALKKEDLNYKLIYITPERMRSNEFLEIFRNLYKKDLISMVAIDEAHCISEWGHDFRPSYRRLGVFREEFPNIPIMAMTATATPQVRQDILANLHIDGTATVFESSFNRPNLYYEVRPKVMVTEDIAHFINSSPRYKHASGLIYCLTKNDSQELADELRRRNIQASPYHSSMPAAMRHQIQDSWKDGSTKVLCTTTAFGLGVDKSDLRYVIHHTVPLSLEAYYQQTGRAGRDGKDSTCILYYAQSDFIRATKMLAMASNSSSGGGSSANADESELLFESGGSMGVKVDLMDNVVTYCSEEKKCRREILLSYFGEKIHRSACNNKCDNCQSLLARKSKHISNNPLSPSPSPSTSSSPSPSTSSSPSPSTSSSPSDFLPPPHISLSHHHHQEHHEEYQGKVAGKNIHNEEEIEEEEEIEIEIGEEGEKLSPLEKLRRRRLAKKEWREAKLIGGGGGGGGKVSHPKASAAPVYDKVSKIKGKRARDRMMAYKLIKGKNDKRVEEMRAAHFKPDNPNIEKVYGTSDPNRFGKKDNKTKKSVRLDNSTSTSTSTSSSTPPHTRKFGNSLRSGPKEKLNKTGRKISSASEEGDEGETTRSKPKHLMGILRKHNSMQFKKSGKLNKTGKIEEREKDYENDDEPPKPTWPLKKKFGNSLRNYAQKEKINKTGKITNNSTTTNNNFKNKSTKLNKTGRIAPPPPPPPSTSHSTPPPLSKPNPVSQTITSTKTSTTTISKTITSPTSTTSPSTTSTTPSTSTTLSQTTTTTQNLFTADKGKLRDYLSKLQASSVATSSYSSSSDVLNTPTKAAMTSLSSLKRVYAEIARENKRSTTTTTTGKDTAPTPHTTPSEFLAESVMMNIWSTKPTSILELTSIPGVGSKNATKYADRILPLFRK